MPYSDRNPTREVSWKELVERIDGPGRTKEDLYPVVYVFSNGEKKRSSGPNSGIYEGDS